MKYARRAPRRYPMVVAQALHAHFAQAQGRVSIQEITFPEPAWYVLFRDVTYIFAN